MENNNKRPLALIRGEIKYIVFIMIFVASIIFNYLTVSNKVSDNAYRIGQIENARASAWSKYDIQHDEVMGSLLSIQLDVMKIKTHMGID